MIRTRRVNAYASAPDAMDALLRLHKTIEGSGLENSLINLVKVRASQINRCAFCIDLHTRHARAAGETERRLYLLSAWRESSVFDEEERAALGWTEALTRIADDHAKDDLFKALRKHFADAEIAYLTALIGLINAWNRLAVGLAYEHG